MTETELTNYLLSMGYRQFADGKKYAKPVGYHIWIYNIETFEFLNLIKGKDSRIHIYNGDKIEFTNMSKDEFLKNLKYIECYSRSDIDCDSNFEFYDFEGYLNIIL